MADVQRCIDACREGNSQTVAGLLLRNLNQVTIMGIYSK